jgi:hypothetical protein
MPEWLVDGWSSVALAAAKAALMRARTILAAHVLSTVCRLNSSVVKLVDHRLECLSITVGFATTNCGSAAWPRARCLPSSAARASPASAAGQAAAEALYRVVDAAYERRSVAVTSNLHPSGFDTIMPRTLATATVDRLLHHAHIVLTEGTSLRLAEATTGKGVIPLT